MRSYLCCWNNRCEWWTTDALQRRIVCLWAVATNPTLLNHRYPSFMDALRDLDDALTMVHLFSVLPSSNNRDQSIPVSLTNAARRLSMEFDAYVVKTNSLRKVFVSVRGFYYQVMWTGLVYCWVQALQAITTWRIPHDLNSHLEMGIQGHPIDEQCALHRQRLWGKISHGCLLILFSKFSPPVSTTAS